MKIKDIVNRDIVNLTNCEQEPIHIPGSIQPHGFLIGLKEDSFEIDYCSENISEYTGLSHHELLGKPFISVFGEDNLSKIKQYIADDRMLSSSLLKLVINDVRYLCTLHK